MGNHNLPTNVYYDANIINNDQSGTKPPPRQNIPGHTFHSDSIKPRIVSVTCCKVQSTNREFPSNIHGSNGLVFSPGTSTYSSSTISLTQIPDKS